MGIHTWSFAGTEWNQNVKRGSWGCLGLCKTNLKPPNTHSPDNTRYAPLPVLSIFNLWMTNPYNSIVSIALAPILLLILCCTPFKAHLNIELFDFNMLLMGKRAKPENPRSKIALKSAWPKCCTVNYNYQRRSSRKGFDICVAGP